MTAPATTELLATSTAESGVPPKVTDPTTLAKVAALLLGGTADEGEGEAT